MATWPTFECYDQLVQDTARECQRVLPLSNVTVACGPPGRGEPSRPYPAFIPGQGAGSYTHATAQGLNVTRGDPRVDGACIVVSCDVSRQWHPVEMRAQLPYLVAHEWHHAARILAGTWRDGLVDAVIAEGLADQFAHEQTAYDPPWCYATEEDLPNWERVAREEPEPYSHAKWFFGEGLPPWIGYALGYAIVGRYLLQHRTTARESVTTDSLTIWEPIPEYPLDLYALVARRHAAVERVRAYDGRLLSLVPSSQEVLCRRG